MIPVTKPFLPPIEDYMHQLEGIWQRNWLTNNGPLVNELESKLKEYLKTQNLLFLSNGTIAIQIAIKALRLKGTIITTPFSYVATTSSIVWEGCRPVFVDIDAHSLNIDAAKIEAAITPETVAILATHCFGNPCDVEQIAEIAKRHRLKVIYDAAHCFGTLYKGESIFNWGDISTTSFHATKLFHTVEGGAVFANDPELIKAMAFLRNFGHNGPEKFATVGVNAKNSEFHAAMGICNLNYIDHILAVRKSQHEKYNELFSLPVLQKISILEGAEYNYAYYPLMFENEEVALKVKASLEENNIFPRRYFYPSLSSLNYVEKQDTPISDDVACRILCMPLYHEMTGSDQQLVADVVLRSVKSL